MKPEYKPLYMQVLSSIKERIESGVYSLSAALPSENVFAKEYEVSISTIRQAIAVLVADGLLEKKQGKGTFIIEKKHVVRFFTWLPETPRGKIILLELIRMIETKYDNIKLKIIETTYLQAKSNLEKLIAEGNAPDLAQIVSHWTGSFAVRGALCDLEKVISDSSLNRRCESKDLHAGRIGGKLFSVSWGMCPIAMIANLDVLNKYGIELKEEKLSLAEWSEMCRKVGEASNGEIYGYGLAHNDGEADFLRVYQFLLSFGGEFVSDRGEIVLYSEQNIEALEWLKEFVEVGNVLFSDIIDIREKFAANKIAFMHDGPWSYLWLSELTGVKFDSRFKALVNPVYCESKNKYQVLSRSWNYNHALVIPCQSEVVAYAVKVLDSLTLDPDISGYYSTQSGHLPVEKCRIIPGFTDTDFCRVFSEQLRGAKNINADNILFPQAVDFCVDALHNIFMHGVDVAEELAEKQHYLEILYGC